MHQRHGELLERQRQLSVFLDPRGNTTVESHQNLVERSQVVVLSKVRQCQLGDLCLSCAAFCALDLPQNTENAGGRGGGSSRYQENSHHGAGTDVLREPGDTSTGSRVERR